MSLQPGQKTSQAQDAVCISRASGAFTVKFKGGTSPSKARESLTEHPQIKATPLPASQGSAHGRGVIVDAPVASLLTRIFWWPKHCWKGGRDKLLVKQCSLGWGLLWRLPDRLTWLFRFLRLDLHFLIFTLSPEGSEERGMSVR